MIIFKTVRWKNALSYGNTWSEVQLDRNPSTIIVGKNGYGKSAIMDVLVFGLFGKPYRKIKKEHLINLKNGKDLVVEVNFSINSDDYLIRRGIKPNIFEIYKNGTLINQDASSRDYQKYLEANILSMDYHSACQIVFVGKAQHTTFMQLNPGERRRFVEIILNLIVFSTMAKLHSTKMSVLKNRIQDIKNAITVTGEKIRIRKKYITDLEADQSRNHEAELERIRANIASYTEELRTLEVEKMSIEHVASVDKNEYRNLMTKLSKNVETLARINTALTDIDRKIKTLTTSTNCYACDRPLEEHDHEKKLLHEQAKREQAKNAVDELNETISDLRGTIENFEEAISKYDAYIESVREIDIQINSVQRSIDTWTNALNEDRDISDTQVKIESERAELAKMQDLYSNLEAKLDELIQKSEYYSMIGSILQDKGIKSMLIKKFIPIINHQVNAHLAQLGLFVNFHLDENFDETIMARGFDKLGYNSFSEGEKLRMDMAMLLAWREVAKMQGNVSTNLLIFDEIFDSSLDVGGAESLADLLTYTENLNVFIITHTPEKIADKVRSIMKVEKIDGFSVLK